MIGFFIFSYNFIIPYLFAISTALLILLLIRFFANNSYFLYLPRIFGYWYGKNVWNWNWIKSLNRFLSTSSAISNAITNNINLTQIKKFGFQNLVGNLHFERFCRG